MKQNVQLSLKSLCLKERADMPEEFKQMYQIIDTSDNLQKQILDLYKEVK